MTDARCGMIVHDCLPMAKIGIIFESAKEIWKKIRGKGKLAEGKGKFPLISTFPRPATAVKALIKVFRSGYLLIR